MRSSVVEMTPRAQSVEVTQDELVVLLVDGRRLSVPVVWFPRLCHASEDARNNWELLGDGEGIHWLDIDEDLSIEGLLLGRRSRSD